MNRAQKLIAILGIFGIIAALGYWIYLYVVEGEAPSLGDVWAGAKGAATSVTGIGKMNFDQLAWTLQMIIDALMIYILFFVVERKKPASTRESK